MIKNKDVERDDVKEYRPKKKTEKINVAPTGSVYISNEDVGKKNNGGIMMSIAEIIDFSEGTDSQTHGD